MPSTPGWSVWWVALVLVVFFVSLAEGLARNPMSGIRVGEALHPGPLAIFDDPEADLMDEASFDDLVDGHDLHETHFLGDPIPNASDDDRCRLDLDPSVGFRAYGKASKSVSQFAGWADGWVFKKGPLGLGYYIDDPDVVVRAFTTESQSSPHDMVLSYLYIYI